MGYHQPANTKPPDSELHHILQFLFEEADRQRISIEKLGQQAGVCPFKLRRLKRLRRDAHQGGGIVLTRRLRELDRCLLELGYELIAQKIGDG